MRDVNRDLKESELIKDRCERIKQEVQRMTMLSAEFKRYVDETFKIN